MSQQGHGFRVEFVAGHIRGSESLIADVKMLGCDDCYTAEQREALAQAVKVEGTALLNALAKATGLKLAGIALIHDSGDRLGNPPRSDRRATRFGQHGGRA